MELISELLGQRVYFYIVLILQRWNLASWDSVFIFANSASSYCMCSDPLSIPVIPDIPAFRSFRLSASPDHTAFSVIPVHPVSSDLSNTKIYIIGAAKAPLPVVRFVLGFLLKDDIHVYLQSSFL